MAMTKANIHTEIRVLLNEVATGFFLDTQIDNWIDQAAIDISSKALCYEASGEITLVQGQLDYAVPTDCIKVVACQFANKGLMRIYPWQIGHISDTIAGPPQFYYDFATKIGIWPLCDTASNGKKVTVLFSKKTDDITKIVDQYQPYGILYGLYRGLIKDSKYGNANNILTRYLNNLLFHRQDLQEREVDSWEMMKIPDRIVREKE